MTQSETQQKCSCKAYPWIFPLVSTSFSLLLFNFPSNSSKGNSNWKIRNESKYESVTFRHKKMLSKHSHCHHKCHTLFLFLDLPGWNFLSVCLVWISMRSSSPASALISPFWLFFLVPVGPRLPTTSLGFGPFFFPGGRPEFWEVVRGALESGEPGNWGPVRPMFCWKMSYQRIRVPFSK